MDVYVVLGGASFCFEGWGSLTSSLKCEACSIRSGESPHTSWHAVEVHFHVRRVANAPRKRGWPREIYRAAARTAQRIGVASSGQIKG